MPTYNVDLTSVDQGEEIIQVMSAPVDGYLIVEINGTDLTDDVIIRFQQSVSGNNWDVLKDFRGLPIEIFLQGGSSPSQVRVETLEPFRASNLRAIVKAKKNEGEVDIIIP